MGYHFLSLCIVQVGCFQCKYACLLLVWKQVECFLNCSQQCPVLSKMKRFMFFLLKQMKEAELDEFTNCNLLKFTFEYLSTLLVCRYLTSNCHKLITKFLGF